MKKSQYQIKNELDEKKKESLRVIQMKESIDKMIEENTSGNNEVSKEEMEEKLLDEMTKNEDENLKRYKEEEYGYKKNGEMYKTTKYQREYQQNYRDRRKNKTNTNTWISENRDGWNDYQRKYQKKLRENSKELVRMKNETIYFQVEGNDEYGNLTLPTEILNGLVSKSKEVILSFTLHEESEKGLGQVSIDFIPIGGEEKQESHRGKMLVEKKIVFGIPEPKKENE
tara:strand:+ start:1673 stop:2353 length:681 start_codon:yes stop_codon:yes gene_type:complete